MIKKQKRRLFRFFLKSFSLLLFLTVGSSASAEVNTFTISEKIQTKNEAATYVQQGSAHYSQGKFSQASKDYNNAIRLDPKNPGAYYGRALVHYALKEYPQSVEDFSKAISLNPQYAYAFYGRALAYYAQAKYQQAIKDYSNAIALDSKYAYAYEGRGLAYEQLGQHDQAVDDWQKACQFGLDSTCVRLKQNGQGNPAGGDTQGNSDTFKRSLAIVNVFNGKFAEALLLLDPLIKNNPTDLDLRQFRIDALIGIKDFESAKKDIKWVLKQEPNNVTTLRQRSRIRFINDDLSGALEDLNTAIAQDSKDIENYYLRAMVFMQDRSFEDAIPDLTRVLQDPQANPEAYFFRGQCYLLVQDYSHSIYDLTQFMTKDPKSARIPLAYYLRSASFGDTGEYQKGLADLAKAEGLDPRLKPMVRDMKGTILSLMGHCQQAEEEFGLACQLGFSNACNKTCN